MKWLDELYNSFARDEQLAQNLESPNPIDTLEIKAAIVGFSYYSKTELWSSDEYEYVTRLLNEVEGFSQRERLFYAIGIGYLLGQRRSNAINMGVFRNGIAQLPGFIFLKGGNF